MIVWSCEHRDLSVLNMTKVQFKNCIKSLYYSSWHRTSFVFSMFYNHLRALVKYLSCSIKTCQYTECQQYFELWIHPLSLLCDYLFRSTFLLELDIASQSWLDRRFRAEWVNRIKTNRHGQGMACISYGLCVTRSWTVIGWVWTSAVFV